jgi:hypothetical protein
VTRRKTAACELPVAQAAELPCATPEDAWLVRSLWSRRAVGIISGHPKVGKTWLSLDLALSVASKTPCLGTFPVDDPGPALVFLAEDALPRIRERLVSLCALRGLALAEVPLHVITAAQLRLDVEDDRDRLATTVARLRPRLLVLDPLVRLHGGDENDARYVAALLGFLRRLAREHDLAIALVHHMSKKNRRQLGQALRGSSDLWAWSDSAAYLTRTAGQVLLTVEHRAAAAVPPVPLALVLGEDGQTPHLACVTGQAVDAPLPVMLSLEERLLQVLRVASQPVSRVALRRELGVNNARLGETLVALENRKALVRTKLGWLLAPQVAAPATSAPTAAPTPAPARSPPHEPSPSARQPHLPGLRDPERK